MSTPSPTPWLVENDGFNVSILDVTGACVIWNPRDESDSDNWEVDSAMIVRAVNAHAELLAACQAVIDECQAVFVDTDEMSPAWIAIESACRAAIAKAQGETK